jgi:large subunit ribosomal protein LX
MSKQFRIRGRFRMGERMQPFVKVVRSRSEERALERVYSDLGSKHKTPRNRIIIEKVEEV